MNKIAFQSKADHPQKHLPMWP